MINIQTKLFIDEQEWNSLVVDIYGKPYDFQQQDGCRERGIHFLTIPYKYPEDFEDESIPYKINGDDRGVSFKAWLATDAKEYPDIFWERNFYPHIEMVANDLYNKGELASGEYVVNIDW